jgi:arsenate reductase-like glutaredoxin family protein
VKEEQSAAAKLGADKALELAKAAGKVIVMKGKKVTTFDMKKDKPSDKDLLEVMLGPTGNLRAPVVLRGKTVLVGFNQDVFDEVLG